MSLTREEARYVMAVSLKRAKDGKPSIVREVLDKRVRDESPAPYYVNGTPVFHLRPRMYLDGDNAPPYDVKNGKETKNKSVIWKGCRQLMRLFKY